MNKKYSIFSIISLTITLLVLFTRTTMNTGEYIPTIIHYIHIPTTLIYLISFAISITLHFIAIFKKSKKLNKISEIFNIVSNTLTLPLALFLFSSLSTKRGLIFAIALIIIPVFSIVVTLFRMYKDYTENSILIINTKNQEIKINKDTKELYYMNYHINLRFITSVEILNGIILVDHASMNDIKNKEFYFEKKDCIYDNIDKGIDDFKVVLRTSILNTSIIYINATYDDCIELTNLIFLLSNDK